MRRRECTEFLRWALPRMGMRWAGLRRVQRQVCRRLARRLRELELGDLDAYRDRLRRESSEWRRLEYLCRITISRFGRDLEAFEALAHRVLLRLPLAKAPGRSLCVWSAGCASGEEPYTLRLVKDHMPQLQPLRLEIMATDVDPRLLERARRAVYRGSSLRELPPDWRREAFDLVGEDRYRLCRRYRQGVRFCRQDLRRQAPQGPFQLILCRNLAFTYYGVELQRQILERLRQRLVRGGALMLGAGEELPEEAVGFRPWPGTQAIFKAE